MSKMKRNILVGLVLSVPTINGQTYAMQAPFSVQKHQPCLDFLQQYRSEIVEQDYKKALNSQGAEQIEAAKELLKIKACVGELQGVGLRLGSAKTVSYFSKALDDLIQSGGDWNVIENIANPVVPQFQGTAGWDNDKMTYLNRIDSQDISKKVLEATAPQGQIDRAARNQAIQDLLKIRQYVNELLPYSKAGTGSQKRLTILNNALKEVTDRRGNKIDWRLLEGAAQIAPTGPMQQQGISNPVQVNSTQIFASSTATDRQSIFQIDQDCAAQGYRVNGQVINLPSLTRTSQQNSREVVAAPSVPFNQQHQTQIRVFNEDSLNHAIGMMQKGEAKKPLVMDMAHASLPCGLAMNGEGNAQEEQICYRSNLYPILKQFKDKGMQAGKKNTDYFVPNLGGIYANQVAVIREDAQNGYKFMDQPILLDIFATAAYRHDSRKAQGKIVDSDIFPELKDPAVYWGNTKAKIRAMFQAAIVNGNDALVLSAFGTGAFQNPTGEIIKLFQEVIQEYNGAFKYIDFAVFDPKGNTFKVFKAAF